MRKLSCLDARQRRLDATYCNAAVSIALAAALGACSFPRPEQSDAGPIDEALCAGGFLTLCGATVREEELTITASQELDTGNDPRCLVKTQLDGPELCILYFTEVDIAANTTLTVHGSRALVLASASTLTIAGAIDLSSKRSRLAKPGPSSHDCPFSREPENDGGGGGGGAGGTFATQGGAGGTGDRNDDNGVGASADAGMPGAAEREPPSVLRGGCHGQKGGNSGGAGGEGGPGGLGGGAIYLFAKGTLDIYGRLGASGSGGGGGGNRGGGGGGGSGGTIVIESETRSLLSGNFLATGGGGGEGGDTGASGPAASGEDPSSPTAAVGGMRLADGGNGGAGATYLGGTAVSAGVGLLSDGGGGGGGGGTGFIVLRGAGQMPSGSFAPAPISQ